jgi:hypothetical protein
MVIAISGEHLILKIILIAYNYLFLNQKLKKNCSYQIQIYSRTMKSSKKIVFKTSIELIKISIECMYGKIILDLYNSNSQNFQRVEYEAFL